MGVFTSLLVTNFEPRAVDPFSLSALDCWLWNNTNTRAVKWQERGVGELQVGALRWQMTHKWHGKVYPGTSEDTGVEQRAEGTQEADDTIAHKAPTYSGTLEAKGGWQSSHHKIPAIPALLTGATGFVNVSVSSDGTWSYLGHTYGTICAIETCN